MRKDVRMGFAVGGVLLAVIIVAVLVVHRNKAHDNKVALDLTGKSAPSGEAPDVDVTPPSSSAAQNSAQNGAAPAEQPRTGGDGNSAKPSDPQRPPADAGGAAADRWNQLFVSTAADPIKELGTLKQQPKAAARADDSIDANSPQPDLGGEHNVNPGIDSAVETSTVLSDARPTTRPVDSTTPRTHRITQNETFVSIAKMVYGDERYFKAIERANPTLNPAKLRPGVVIQLPSMAEVKQGGAKSSGQPPAKSSAPSGPALSADGSRYTVQNGDNLYKISRKLYGDGSKEGELYTANRDKIGPDPTRLKVGMVLQVPEKPTITASR